MNIERLLENIGLSKKEVSIYLALLKVNTATVSQLSKETRIKRTTIYPFLDSLKSKGLVEWGVDKYNRNIQVKDPKNLLTYAENRERKYGRTVLTLKAQIDEIQKQYVQDVSDVEVRYFEGVDECKEMLQELLKVEGEIVGYSSWWRYQTMGEEWCHALEKKIERVPTFTKEIKIISATEHNLWHGQEYVKLPNYGNCYFFRFIPPKKEFIKVDIFLFNDIKLTLSYKGVRPNGIYIKNRDLVESEKTIFEVLYDEVGLEYEQYLQKHKIDKVKLKHSHEGRDRFLID